MRQIFSQMLWVALSATATVAGALVSTAQAATFVYVGNAESNDIYVLQLNRQTGELALVETVPVPGVVKSGMSTPMAVSPDRRFLFAATRGEPQAVGQRSHRMSSYQIVPDTGKLTKLREYPMGKSPNWIEIVGLPAK